MADIAIALVEAYARDADLPGVRVGLACGPTLSWEGDLYGPTVNLASRLVNFARPNTVLISEDLGKLLADDPRFALRHLRPSICAASAACARGSCAAHRSGARRAERDGRPPRGRRASGVLSQARARASSARPPLCTGAVSSGPSRR